MGINWITEQGQWQSGWILGRLTPLAYKRWSDTARARENRRIPTHFQLQSTHLAVLPTSSSSLACFPRVRFFAAPPTFSKASFMFRPTSYALLLLIFVSMRSTSAQDIMVADFESTSYDAWKVTGDAFGPGPAEGALPGQMHVDGFTGKRLVNSFYQGDNSTGSVQSPEFTIERNYLRFLIGGGKHAEQLALQLIVDGKAVRTATGPNDRPGGSERLDVSFWDVTEFKGRSVSLRIIDQAQGGWGHINVDEIVQTDSKPLGWVADAEHGFVATKSFLAIPIKNGGTKRVVTVLIDGKVAVRNDIELADSDPDWWALMDLRAWQGKNLTLRVDKLPENSKAFELIEITDQIKGSDPLYAEPNRGQFHFSPRRGWNNDPNGLVYFNGEYHLFFQHNPYGWGWGNMHWGHAVSKDLVRWTELGDALLPDEMGPMFSGSAVVDWNNTSGLGTQDKPPLVLIYTAAGNPTVQGIAYSLDGRTFTKYQGNPVLPQITGGNRDPKVIWHPPTKRWVMVLYVEKPAGLHTVHFFTSPNLRDWTLSSVCNGDPAGQRYLFECPDFFELAVDGNQDNKKWVLLAADTQYAIGTFDGTTFTPEQSRLPGQLGRGFYAPQTYSDIPTVDGRRIQVGWFQTETKGMPFNQSMTIPIEMNLVSTTDGPRLAYSPVAELQSLRTKTHQPSVTELKQGDTNPFKDVRADLVELRMEFEPSADAVLEIDIRGSRIVYDAAKQKLVINGHAASAPLQSGKQDLIIYCDRTGIELFASGGLVYVPLPVNVPHDAKQLSITAAAGRIKMFSMTAYELQSAWPPSR